MKTQISVRDRNFDFVFFKIQSCGGEKTATRITPIITESKIGLRIRKERTRRMKSMAVVIIFLKYSLSIVTVVILKNNWKKFINLCLKPRRPPCPPFLLFLLENQKTA